MLNAGPGVLQFSLFSFFLCICNPQSVCADLVSAGDIAFIGFNTDANDDFAIVLLADAAVGNIVHFNDNEWAGTDFNSTSEDQISWEVTTALFRRNGGHIFQSSYLPDGE